MASEHIYNNKQSIVIYDGIEITAGSFLAVPPSSKFLISIDSAFITDIFDPMQQVYVTDIDYPGIQFFGQDAVNVLQGNYAGATGVVAPHNHDAGYF